MRCSIATLCGISLLWGSQWIFTPLLAEGATPFAAAALTLLFAGLALALCWGVCWVLRGRGDSEPRAAVSLRVTLVLSVWMFVLPFSLVLLASRHGVSGWIPLIYALVPLLLGFAEEAWSPAMIVAVGAVLVLLNSTVRFSLVQLVWALPVLGAAISVAFAMRSVSRRLRSYANFNLLRTLALECLLGSVMLAGVSLVVDHAPRVAPLSAWSGLAGLSLLLLAIPGTALTYFLFYRLLAAGELTPRQVAVTQWLQILVAVVESAVFAHIHPPWIMIAAGIAVAGCTVAVLRGSEEQPLVSRGTLLR